MNLYSINFTHYSPRDSESGIYGYVLAKSDEEVYEIIKSEPKVSEYQTIYNSWKYYEEEMEYNIYDNYYDVIGTENFKERMIRLGGEMYDEDVDVSDSYYGVTHLGWNLIKENVTENEIEVLKSLGLIIQ